MLRMGGIMLIVHLGVERDKHVRIQRGPSGQHVASIGAGWPDIDGQARGQSAPTKLIRRDVDIKPFARGGFNAQPGM